MMPALEKKTNSGILVVDDDPNEMRSLVIGLRLEGFDAVGAPGGTEAMTMLRDGNYCAVLIDLMMPEINGLQLARTIRASYPLMTTILMSAYHLSPIQLARADTGVVGFVPKPFCFDELVRFIQSKIDPDGPRKASHGSPLPGAGLNMPIDVQGVVNSPE